uniref:C-type lectin domain-containing protein n=1 Tax=Cyprinus carpio TaxID=7962 RepID=A0A8C2HV25_CYPCA
MCEIFLEKHFWFQQLSECFEKLGQMSQLCVSNQEKLLTFRLELLQWCKKSLITEFAYGTESMNKYGWKCHQSSLYFISSEIKNWTESRNYCTDRAADLIIINNTEEQNFSGGSDRFWIGLTDIEVERRWKWVDGISYHTEKPNNIQGKEEDCALNYSAGWADYPCDYMSKWICEKNEEAQLSPLWER